mmetsp:Transcript_4789/g.11948  ORF Transcript_4789/g.11948 Transcript_4789/m.11948 type:complete len:217 (+) Transcript_4789:1029-1679(+)
MRRASAPVDESNEPSRIVESWARHRTASGGTAPCCEESARTASGTTPSRIRSRSEPSAEMRLPPSSSSVPLPPTPFSPDIFLSRARSSPSANTTRRLKLGGTSFADLAKSAKPPGAFFFFLPSADPAPADSSSGGPSSSSSSPYLAFLYRSPASGPLASTMVGSEPGVGSLIRYHPFSQTRFPVSLWPLSPWPRVISSMSGAAASAASRSSAATPS